MTNKYRPRGTDVRLVDSGAVSTNVITGDIDEWSVPANTEMFIEDIGIVADTTITAIGTTDPFVILSDQSVDLLRADDLKELFAKSSINKQFTLNSIVFNWCKVKLGLALLYPAATKLGWGGRDANGTPNYVPANPFTATGTDTDELAVGLSGWQLEEKYHNYVTREEKLVRKRGTPYNVIVDMTVGDYSTTTAKLITAANLASDNYVVDELRFSMLGGDNALTECSVEIYKGSTLLYKFTKFTEVMAVADDVFASTPAAVTAVLRLKFPIVLESTSQTLEVKEIAASKVTIAASTRKVSRSQWLY